MKPPLESPNLKMGVPTRGPSQGPVRPDKAAARKAAKNDCIRRCSFLSHPVQPCGARRMPPPHPQDQTSTPL